MRIISDIILHCSASDLEGQNAALIDKWHRERGFSKIGYHYFIGRSGLLEKGRSEDEIGAHCEGANAHSIGICLAGLTSFKIVQFQALTKLLEELKTRYPNAKISGHREWPSAQKQGKTCPVYDVSGFKLAYEMLKPQVEPAPIEKESIWKTFINFLSKIFQRSVKPS